MIPIRDTVPSKNVPIINNLLIGINVVMFVVQMMQGSDYGFQRFIYEYGLVPARYTSSAGALDVSHFQMITALFSFMFLHGGFLHLLGNMWFLYIFGDNVEDRLGPARYIVFYLLCGLVSGLSHIALNAHSTAPTIGASGAVAGVMGAYFLLHPSAKILTLIPIIIIPWFVEIPAFFFLGLWFLIQLFNASAQHGSSGGGIAWWAHIGGFLFGMLLLKLFDAVPATGISSGLRKATTRKTTHRFQMVRPAATTQERSDLHGTITISPYEALVGTRKLVTVPQGFQRRVFRVNVPPGIEAGKVLRLRAMGGTAADGRRGDLLLKVVIQ
jgi:membrane associated rhomboid family serine protease